MSVTYHRYAAAADRLPVSEAWLRRHIKRLPHTKAGREVLFTEADLDRIRELLHVEPEQPVVEPMRVDVAGSPVVQQIRPLPARRSARKSA